MSQQSPRNASWFMEAAWKPSVIPSKTECLNEWNQTRTLVPFYESTTIVVIKPGHLDNGKTRCVRVCSSWTVAWFLIWPHWLVNPGWSTAGLYPSSPSAPGLKSYSQWQQKVPVLWAWLSTTAPYHHKVCGWRNDCWWKVEEQKKAGVVLNEYGKPLSKGWHAVLQMH